MQQLQFHALRGILIYPLDYIARIQTWKWRPFFFLFYFWARHVVSPNLPRTCSFWDMYIYIYICMYIYSACARACAYIYSVRARACVCVCSWFCSVFVGVVVVVCVQVCVFCVLYLLVVCQGIFSAFLDWIYLSVVNMMPSSSLMPCFSIRRSRHSLREFVVFYFLGNVSPHCSNILWTCVYG